MESAVPQAAAIWMILLLVAAIAAAGLTLPRKFAGAGPAMLLEPVPEQPGDRLDADLRYAEEVAAAADRAAATAQRRRERWQAAQEDVDAAWAAYEEADRAARRTAAATAYPVMRRRRPGDNADRQRYLHHAATAACRQHEISIAQLNDILAHRGWNPRLHPAAQESALRNAIRDHRYATYLSAAERERQAWETAEEAAEALRTLRAEACVATVRTSVDALSADADWWAEQWTTAEPARAAAA